MINSDAVSAAVVENLYETQVPVVSQTAAARNAAFRNSMKQVLIKVSGSRTVPEDPRLSTELARARDYIQSFTFTARDDTQFMVASFDETRINQLLSQFQFPIWGKRRPDTLLWLVIQDEQGERELITTNRFSIIRENVERYTDMRGIEVSFPLMDLVDAENINVFDIWGRFDDTIRAASQRYVTDNVVAARLYPRGLLSETQATGEMSWQLDWQLLNADLTEEGTLFAADPSAVLFQFTDFMADRLASDYAFSSEVYGASEGIVEVKIINLSSIESYVSVTRFFTSLAMVSQVNLINLNGDIGTFELTLSGATADLMNTLQLDDKIQGAQDAFGRNLNNMEFLWQP